jgi:hypothetical protein
MLAFGQTGADQPSPKPQVKVNVLNVCTPSDADRREISAALAAIPLQPRFGVEMEVSRGRSLSSASDIPDVLGGAQVKAAPTISDWVRLRREFPDGAALTSAQYSFSANQGQVTETLVLHLRETKTALQVSISDTVTAGANVVDVARTDTPADRVRIERFGKSSIVLARCASADQTVYESLFAQATKLLNAYRDALKTKTTIPGELSRLGVGAPAKPKK